MEKQISKTKYTVQLQVKDIFEILNEPISKECEEIKDDVLTNISYNKNFMRKDGALFIGKKYLEKELQEYLNKAKEVGVKVVFLTQKQYDSIDTDIVTVIRENILKDVIKISAHIRQNRNLTVIGVTGSLGKTTTKDIITKVMQQKYNTQKSFGNQNTIFPIFENLQKLKKDTEIFVQEFGIATPGVMFNTVMACVPDASVITNISDPHIDLFGTRENLLKEKLKMAELTADGCPLFLNYDDERLKQVSIEKHPIVSFAIDNKNADYYADDIKIYDDCIEFNVVNKNERTPVSLNTRGKHNMYNALAAFAVGAWFNVLKEDIAKGIGEYKGYGIRQSLVNIGGYEMFLDCYNTAPVSLIGAVKVLEKLPVKDGGRRIAVIGDIAKLGHEAPKLHKETGEAICNAKIDIAYCFGNENAKILADVMGRYDIITYYTDDREELNEWLRNNVTRNDIMLFKGPVPRLLSKTVDQVYGTSFHIKSEHFDRERLDDFDIRVIYEKENHDMRTVALIAYNGDAEKVKIPEKYNETEIFSIGPKSFAGNKALKEVVIPDTIKNIAPRAFADCSALEKVVLPKGLITIEQNAFLNCVNLREIDLPEGLIHIGENAFKNCIGLKRIKLSSNIGFIGKNAFLGCKAARYTVPENLYANQLFVKEINRNKLINRIKRKIKKMLK